MPTRSDLLANVPIFSTLDPKELDALAERVDEMREPAGTILFHAGDPGDALYVVIEGTVEVYVLNPIGDRIVMERA
ncbi:MAG TPA: cyclic nucleotide-binding domain-containing protein, partial [Polyangiales bacterium]|nr:cyclic nucleotide-binding domain-containing protein [Polyangiales bacterium]